ncbi:tryptophan 2,3-dioxygenase family protein [Marinoscillum sp. 108]|jgi:tryptophan 2,3-dioxygenase|uniref:tryptophan 2,3-dioxygenase family protein n=1 Tax=Marinoscillum sp. 108 TaxID=2653151 RepID=UPI0012F33E27|nr:tryptophan 2,3-dioxygenase family protein [Marinoscillum sp. 108]VXD10499.1 Tryptophan 2,3-dioxygenase [Marinoscillum sp. 108]
MGNRNFSEEILTQLEKLEAKYDAMGQDLSAYLDGLLHSDYLTYWDYIRLDTLLSLQTPRTSFPDEKIFILYHQITELYFKLILNEQDQLIMSTETPERDTYLKRVKRMNRYFDHLIDSFDVMIDGMDPEQFLNFRMSLLPSSGFQSGQYRLVEIGSTDFHLLTCSDTRDTYGDESDVNEIYEHLYWKKGATELATGKKTLTLKQFEKKYSDTFVSRAREVRKTNLRKLYHDFFEGDQEIAEALKNLDHKANVQWPLMHYKSAVRYLQKDPEVIKATGGTNWQKYLPPRRQQVIFYPELWSAEELAQWGTREKL